MFIRDYRKNKKHYEEDKENNNICQKYNTRLLQLSTFSCGIFESLLTDNLIMGSFKSLSESSNDSVNCENSQNTKVYQLQTEWCNLIEVLLYLDSIDKLLQSWQNIIKKIACEAIPKKPGIQWLTTWSSHLELYLNNYQWSGIWYEEFLTVTKLHTSSTLRLVAYLLLQKVIEHTFRKKAIKKDQTADCNLIPENIIVLEPIEASKFFYIVDWVVYKLTKSDKQTKSHPQFKAICAHLEILNSEQVVYEQDVRSQITNVIPGQEFLEFMYKMESLILLLFEKHKELGPNTLQYIYTTVYLATYHYYNLLIYFLILQTNRF